MPGKCQGSVLAGMTAVLSMCMAGTGCQSINETDPPPLAARNSSGGLNPAWAWLRPGQKSGRPEMMAADRGMTKGTPIAVTAPRIEELSNDSSKLPVVSVANHPDRASAETAVPMLTPVVSTTTTPPACRPSDTS